MASKTVKRSDLLSLVFLCQENPRRSGIVIFPDCPRFQCWLMKTRNRNRIPDRLGWTGTNLNNWDRFYFPNASQISAMVGDHFQQMKLKFLPSGKSAMEMALHLFRHDTTTKCHAGVSSPRLLYRGENLTLVRKLSTVSRKRETTTGFGVKSVCP